MNPTLQTQLDAIKAACREAIALADAATGGPWRANGSHIHGSRPYVADALNHNAKNDAAFIAASRELTPALAEATLEAIEGLEYALAIVDSADIPKSAERLSARLQRIADNWTRRMG